MFSFWELVNIISENELCDLLWNVAASYECKGDADAEDQGGDAVDERNKRRYRPPTDFGEWKNDVVHDTVEGHTEERAVEEGVTREGEFAAGKEEDGGGGEGDEEMEEQAEERRADAHAKGGAAEGPAGDALENPGGGYAAETVEDEGVRDVECADEESGTGDDLPEWGAIRGHFHLE